MRIVLAVLAGFNAQRVCLEITDAKMSHTFQENIILHKLNVHTLRIFFSDCGHFVFSSWDEALIRYGLLKKIRQRKPNTLSLCLAVLVFNFPENSNP